MNIKKTTIQSVEHVGSFDNEYVYDIGVNSSDPYFFANDVLVHNSVYFSAWPAICADVEAGRMEWNKDTAIQVYDNIAEQVNESFPEMMERECHCPRERGALIRGGRELIAETGLFIKKKRYAVLIYDAEGTRLDQYDSETAKKKGVVFGVGKVKAMGLDLKRSDTPKIVQDFLSNILLDVLTGVDRAPIIEKIIKFKKEFAMLPPWEKGTPKRVNNLSKYTAIYEKTKECGVGHVKAAIVWNIMRKMHGDNYSMKIVDGMKTIVCKLKTNPLGYTSIAYPTDEKHVPEWLKELPFDVETMEATVVDQKVENLLSVLGWDITNNTCTNSSFSNLFSFK